MLNLLLFSLIVYKSPVETKALQSCKDGSDRTGGAVRISPVILAGESVCKQSSLSTKSVVTENQEHQKDYKRPVLEKQDICDTLQYIPTHTKHSPPNPDMIRGPFLERAALYLFYMRNGKGSRVSLQYTQLIILRSCQHTQAERDQNKTRGQKTNCLTQRKRSRLKCKRLSDLAGLLSGLSAAPTSVLVYTLR